MFRSGHKLVPLLQLFNHLKYPPLHLFSSSLMARQWWFWSPVPILYLHIPRHPEQELVGATQPLGTASLITFIWWAVSQMWLIMHVHMQVQTRTLDFQAIWLPVHLFFPCAPHASVLRRSNSIDLHEPIQLIELLRGVSSCAPYPLSASNKSHLTICQNKVWPTATFSRLLIICTRI